MTTTINGKAKWDSCWRQACYLSKYIYKDPDVGFTTHYPEKMTEAEKNWEVWSEKNDHSKTGLVARLYKVKGWDPGAKDAPPCPPCLVFRGTDFDDMRGLAIYAAVRLHLFGVWDIYTKTMVFDNTMPKQRKVWKAGQNYPDLVDYTPEDLTAMGFETIPIHHDQGRFQVESATRGMFISANIEIQLDVMAKEDGDWASNIWQGLGYGSQQYDKAINFGKIITNEKIRKLNDKRLEISGHSLGGGLAAAVTCFLDRKFPNIHFHAITFNAAGVHANTVKPASLSDGNIDNFTVEDEILTTIQSFTNNVPILGSIFRLAERTIGQRGMPPALGRLRVVNGVSPGGKIAAKGAWLPELFPISGQTIAPAYTGGFPNMTQLDKILQSSATTADVGNRVVAWLNQKYRQQAMINNRASEENYWFPDRIDRIYTEMGRLAYADIKPELDVMTKIMMASTEYHGMDYVIATYEKEYGSS